MLYKTTVIPHSPLVIVVVIVVDGRGHSRDFWHFALIPGIKTRYFIYMSHLKNSTNPKWVVTCPTVTSCFNWWCLHSSCQWIKKKYINNHPLFCAKYFIIATGREECKLYSCLNLNRIHFLTLFFRQISDLTVYVNILKKEAGIVDALRLKIMIRVLIHHSAFRLNKLLMTNIQIEIQQRNCHCWH